MTATSMSTADLMVMARKVAWRCRRMSTAGMDELDDYAQDAMIGGLRALDSHDPSLGGLAPYVWLRMTGSVLDAQRARGYLGRKEMRQVREAYEADPTEPLRLPVNSAPPLSIDALRQRGADDGAATSWDLADPTSTQGFEAFERADLVDWLMRQVDGRQKEVIERTLLGNETLKEVGASWGVTESRACQIRTKGLVKLYWRLQEPDALIA